MGTPARDSLWELAKGPVLPNGQLGTLSKEVRFVLAPTSVRLVPRLRVSIQDTLGGIVKMPWVCPHTGLNIGNIQLEIEGVGNVFLISGQPAQEYATAQYARHSLLELFKLTISPYLQEIDGVLVRERWQLRWITPLFRTGADFMAGDVLSVLGDVVTPMDISERADNPWMPSWRFTFSVTGANIKTFLDQLRRKTFVPIVV